MNQTCAYAIEYSGDWEGDIFLCASDAAYSDDSETWRSSEGYVFILYGGAIDWKASLQKTVILFSTEAELLLLTTTAKETL